MRPRLPAEEALEDAAVLLLLMILAALLTILAALVLLAALVAQRLAALAVLTHLAAHLARRPLAHPAHQRMRAIRSRIEGPDSRRPQPAAEGHLAAHLHPVQPLAAVVADLDRSFVDAHAILAALRPGL